MVPGLVGFGELVEAFFVDITVSIVLRWSVIDKWADGLSITYLMT
jgi:hypothetical protein